MRFARTDCLPQRNFVRFGGDLARAPSFQARLERAFAGFEDGAELLPVLRNMLTEVRQECLFARFDLLRHHLTRAHEIAMTSRDSLRAANVPAELCTLADSVVAAYRRRLDDLHAELDHELNLS